MRYFVSIAVFLLALLFFSYCKKDKGLALYGNYPHDVGKIMVLKCATSGCHNSASYLASAGLNLSTWEDLFKGSNTGSPVIPFRSDFSSLCYFVNIYPELGITNTPAMPLGKDKLTKEEVITIRDWINAGAPDLKGNVKWADDPNRKKVYVTNQGCDVVTVFDSETQLPIRYITVGRNSGFGEVPHMVKVSPDGQYWYVIFTASSYMQKYRCSDDALVGEVNLNNFLDWNTFVITNDGKKAYCVSWTNLGKIASVDLTNMKVINILFPLSFPHGAALNPANDTLYVTAQQGNYIMKIDTSLNSLPTQSITLDGLAVNNSNSLNPHEILLSPDGQKFFITCQNSNDVRVLDIATNAVTNVIPVGTYPVEMALSPLKNKLFVTCMEDVTSFPGDHGSVSRIDLTTFTENRIQVGFMPHGIAVDEGKKLIYVASRNILSSGPPPHHTSVCSGRNGFISFIDLNTFILKSRRTEVSSDPYSVAFRK